jgi:hypothetical protein
MGRKKIESDIKKNRLSVTISKENFLQFEEKGISNKSKLIEWLLEQHFSIGNKKGE